MSSKTQPDILIVVMDAVRFSDFSGGTNPVTPLPFSDALREECLTFPRAASVSSWTVPAHASLFTGLYPWESGVHAKHDLRLNPTIPRLAERLRPLGYRSLGISANPMVFPTFGQVNGFDRAYWANWWEPFLRSNRTRPGTTWDPTTLNAAQGGDDRSTALRRFLLGLSPQLHKAPFLVDGASRFLQKLRDPSRPRDLANVPWIEGSLDQWLGVQPAAQRTFAFINLLEAHEPYLTDSVVTPRLRDWLEYARCRQDHFSCATGHWTPSEKDLTILRRLYRHMISVIDRRLAAFVDVYRERGRWDNTLMVLTSDHGQAFGEHGILFHTLRIDEGEIRIPLWVRYPDSPLVGEGVGWASLIDVAPTVLRAAGAPDWESPSGRDLGQLADKARSEPLLTMSDGLIWTHVDQMLTSERRAWLDQVFVGAYRDEFKVVLEARTGALSAYNIVRDSGEREDLMPQLGTQLESLVSAASAVGQRILGSGAPVRSQEVQDRLKSWGYI